MKPDGSWAPLALRDRAYAFLSQYGAATDDVLLKHVYGGSAPLAMRATLAAPLEDDPRLERRADGTWALCASAARPAGRLVSRHELTTLALAATGPTPGRGRIVQLSALRVRDGTVVGRFTATVNPGKRVPRYVAQRLGLAP